MKNASRLPFFLKIPLLKASMACLSCSARRRKKSIRWKCPAMPLIHRILSGRIYRNVGQNARQNWRQRKLSGLPPVSVAGFLTIPVLLWMQDCRSNTNIPKFLIPPLRKIVILIAWSRDWGPPGSLLQSPQPDGAQRYWQLKKTSTPAASGRGALLPGRTFRMWGDLPKFYRIIPKNIPAATP